MVVVLVDQHKLGMMRRQIWNLTADLRLAARRKFPINWYLKRRGLLFVRSIGIALNLFRVRRHTFFGSILFNFVIFSFFDDSEK